MNATSPALDELKKVLKSEENPQAGVRIFAGKSCCGPSLQMSVEKEALTGDKLITLDSVNFYIAQSAEEMIENVTLDFGPDGFKLEGFKRNTCCCP